MQQTYSVAARRGPSTVIVGVSALVVLAVAVVLTMAGGAGPVADGSSAAGLERSAPGSLFIDDFNQNPRLNPAPVHSDQLSLAPSSVDVFNQNPRMNPAVALVNGAEGNVPSVDVFNQNPRQNGVNVAAPAAREALPADEMNQNPRHSE